MLVICYSSIYLRQFERKERKLERTQILLNDTILTVKLTNTRRKKLNQQGMCEKERKGRVAIGIVIEIWSTLIFRE